MEGEVFVDRQPGCDKKARSAQGINGTRDQAVLAVRI